MDSPDILLQAVTVRCTALRITDTLRAQATANPEHPSTEVTQLVALHLRAATPTLLHSSNSSKPVHPRHLQVPTDLLHREARLLQGPTLPPHPPWVRMAPRLQTQLRQVMVLRLCRAATLRAACLTLNRRALRHLQEATRLIQLRSEAISRRPQDHSRDQEATCHQRVSLDLVATQQSRLCPAQLRISRHRRPKDRTLPSLQALLHRVNPTAIHLLLLLTLPCHLLL